MNLSPDAEALPGDDVMPLAAGLAERIVQLTNLLRREVFAAGLSLTHARVLAALRDLGSARITELAARERVTQPTMTALISRMERLGHVRRGPDVDDRRAVRVSATDAGMDVLARVGAARDAALANAVHLLPAEDADALRAVLPVLDRLIDSYLTTEGMG